MPMYKQIDVDIDLYRLIESNRSTFEESPKDILKRILQVPIVPLSPGNSVEGTARQITPPENRARRSRGTYLAEIKGTLIEGSTLREILKNILLFLSKQDGKFLERLSIESSGRKRKIVAREPSKLYGGDSEFGEKHAERLNDLWWFDTNVSFEQANHYCDIITKSAKLGTTIIITK